jgi:hypothetical protein
MNPCFWPLIIAWNAVCYLIWHLKATHVEDEALPVQVRWHAVHMEAIPIQIERKEGEGGVVSRLFFF